MKEGGDDLRCLITGSYQYYKDVLCSEHAVGQCMFPSTVIPFSNKKLVTMLNVVESIRCIIASNLSMSPLNYILASTRSNCVSSKNMFGIGIACFLFKQ